MGRERKRQGHKSKVRTENGAAQGEWKEEDNHGQQMVQVIFRSKVSDYAEPGYRKYFRLRNRKFSHGEQNRNTVYKYLGSKEENLKRTKE